MPAQAAKADDDAIAHRVTVWARLGRPLRILVILGVAAVTLAIYRLAESLVANIFNVFILFVFAAVIALLLDPVVDWMQRLAPFRLHRGLAVLAIYLLITLVVTAVGMLVGPTLVAEARQVPTLITQFEAQLSSFGLPIHITNQQPGANVELGTAVFVAAQVVGALVDVILVLVISIYLLVQGRTVVATARNLFPSHERTFDFASLAVGSTVVAYVRGQLLLSLMIGTYTGVSMFLLGVHYAIIIGLLAVALEFLPIIGAAITMGIAVAIALLQSPQLALEAAAVGLVGHAFEAYVIGPRINARVAQLHPLVAMAALLVGGQVGGLLGALFAVPIAAIANIFLGAFYRSRQGQEALTTHDEGKVDVENLPRLGEEISETAESEVEKKPVPHAKRKRTVTK